METKYCKDCIYFKSLYKIVYCQFFLYELGKCFKQQKPVDRYGCCERWQEREEQETITPEILNRAVKDLEAIKLILQEETERINKKQE